MQRIYSRKFWWVVGLAILAGVWVTPSPAFQLGGREADQWIERLERPQRVAGLKIDEVVARLDLKPGLVIADIGAGSGVFSRPFAKAVAPGGKVLSVDIEQGLLDYIDKRAKEENLQNIETVLGKYDDPNLPTRQVDLGFIHDVLHHVENREAYLKNLASYPKPGGRIAVIELNSNNPDTPHADRPELLVSREQVDGWMAAAGLHPDKEFDLFGNEKWFVIYAKGSASPYEGMSGGM